MGYVHSWARCLAGAWWKFIHSLHLSENEWMLEGQGLTFSYSQGVLHVFSNDNFRTFFTMTSKDRSAFLIMTMLIFYPLSEQRQYLEETPCIWYILGGMVSFHFSCNVLILSLPKLAFLTNVITFVSCYKRLLLKKSNVSPLYVKWG